jgi:putative PIN family toxin of toxin-antitoxin system
MDEIFEVLMRPELIDFGSYTESDVLELMELLNRRAVIIDSPISFEYCRDPDDDKFVTCAIVGRVQFLVSGDKDFIADEKLKKVLREFGIEVLGADELVGEIEKVADR